MTVRPYDYYDLGDIDQSGSTKTWFDAKDELIDLIRIAHENRTEVYADLVLNHNNSADVDEVNPVDGTRRWAKFSPKSGSFREIGSAFLLIIAEIGTESRFRCNGRIQDLFLWPGERERETIFLSF